MSDTVIQKNIGNPSLGSTNRRINFAVEINRLTDEVQFLRDRIEKIQAFKTPNPTMLNTYNTMLADREKLLRQLQATTSPATDITSSTTG